MKNQIEPALINEEYLRNKIHFIRGQKVILDSDLAMIYGYTTKAFNQQVQRNIEKFDEDFMFQLTTKEYDVLMCQNGTSRFTMNKRNLRSQNVTSSWGGSRYAHYAFTEQGIYMLMTVLRGDLAIKQSKALIRLFKKMKDYIVENRDLLPFKNLELRTNLLEKNVKDNTSAIKTFQSELDKVMDNFIDPNTYKHFLILDGQKLEADIAYRKIFRLAKKSIIYIDDYVNLKTLSMIFLAKDNVDITLITDNKAKDHITAYDVNDFISQNKTNNLTLLKSNNKIHDRFIILDFNTKNERIYHCGSSLKDAGNKITTINELNSTKEYTSTIKKLLKNPVLTLK